MKDIERVVGVKNYARLVKAGVDTPAKIMALSEQQLMAISGIGPKTADKLLRFVGVKTDPSKTKQQYRKVKVKDRFKRVKQQVKQTFKDPKPLINKIENQREGLVHLSNALTGIQNIGREDKKDITHYVPVSLTLDPFRRDFGEAVEDDLFYGEVFVSLLDDKVLVNFNRYDSKSLTKVTDITDRLNYGNRTETTDGVIELLREHLRSFRKSSVTGNMVFVIDKVAFEFMLNAIEEEFDRELSQGLLFLVPSVKDYNSYEALFRFLDSTKFKQIVSRLERFASYREYDMSKTALDYDQFKKENSTWSFMDAFKTKTSSLLLLPGTDPYLTFGFLRGHPDFDKMKTYRVYPVNDVVYHSHSYEEYSAAKRRDLIVIGERTFGDELLGLIDEVLSSNYDIYYNSASDPIMVRSKEIPEIGIIIGGEKWLLKN